MTVASNTAAARSGTAHSFPAFGRFIEDAGIVLSTLLNPRRVIEEVEQMARLHREAAAIEATDPPRAARLREQASRIGLR